MTRYAKKAEKHLTKLTDQFGKLNKMYEAAHENIQAQIKEKARMASHYEDEKESLL